MHTKKRNYIIILISIVIIIILLLSWRGCKQNLFLTFGDVKTLVDSAGNKDTIFIVKNHWDTLVQKVYLDNQNQVIGELNKQNRIFDSLQIENKRLIQEKLNQPPCKENEYAIEISKLRVQLKGNRDSIDLLKSMYLNSLKVVPNPPVEEEIKKTKSYNIITKNILFTGLFSKDGKLTETIFGGQLTRVLLSVEFITNIIKPNPENENVYIRISDFQSDQLIYITDEKPNESYTLNDGTIIRYSLVTKVFFGKQNIANLKIIYPMNWPLKRNSVVRVEVFWKGQKIGESFNQIKSGIPVTTW